MATRITERARKIADATIRANGARAIVWADYQVGARVGQSYGTRYWLRIIQTDGSQINLSTMKEKLGQEWLSLIAENSVG